MRATAADQVLPKHHA